ncbi:hypothetical protein FKW77_003494 [Venturia effusa]|uniref:Uncharacterized protein n=1 Tax=Venturia effusa TaxID=50376 RepID=A0A517LL63_9PEZI|nr:hypothetical protein FKW77_003494 [Venturia effusa]
MSAELDLGKLCLTLAKSELEVHSTTTVFCSRPEIEAQSDRAARLTVDLHTLKHSWVQRGRGLQLRVKVLVEGRPLIPGQLHTLTNVLYKAKIWPQLGLKASSTMSTQDLSDCSSSEPIIVALSYDAHLREQSKDTVHRLCYTIPVADVAPPADFRVLELDAVQLELNIRRRVSMKKQRKHKEAVQDVEYGSGGSNSLQSSLSSEPLLLTTASEAVTLPECLIDSGYESLFSTQTSYDEGIGDMLLTGAQRIEDDEDDMLDVPAALTPSRTGANPYMQTSTEFVPATVKVDKPKKRSASVHDASDDVAPMMIPSDCITSVVDAVLRLSIEEKPWRLRQGLRVESNSIFSPLSGICPSLWCPGYLQEIAIRAPLLPTVAHALSHSIYTNAKSPTLKYKLRTLLYYGTDDADGEADEEDMTIRERDEITPNTRFKLMSALLWQVMQGRLHRPNAARRLKNLAHGLEASNEHEEDVHGLLTDIDGFAATHTSNDFMFDDDDEEEDEEDEEEDMMDYADLDENFDDDVLFDNADYPRRIAGGDEEDMLQHHMAVEPGKQDGHDLLLQDNTALDKAEHGHEDLFAGCEIRIALDEDDLFLQDLDG